MNRLSIINGGLPIQKQNMKQAAYFDYLKSFSQGGLQTLERLQKQFNKYVNKTNQPEENKLFKKIKTLISSYEVFVIQMNDSCQFIEVPEFGSCILKVFIQLIAILKWSLKLIEQNKKEQADKAQDKIFLAKRQSSMMRMTFNGNFAQTVKQSNRCSQCMKNGASTPRNMFRLKQQTTLHLKDISQQIKRINVEYAQAQKNAKQHQKEEWALKKFIQKRNQKNNPNYSKNQEVLSEILAALNRKGQNIARFADLRLTCLNQINKTQNNEEQYEKINKQISLQIAQKVQIAKLKLKQLFKQHIEQYEKQKMMNKVQTGVQINQQDSSKLNKIYETKMIKKLKTDIKKLEKDLQYQRNMFNCLKQLLEEKSVQYEAQIMKYRTQFVCAELKSKRSLKSQKTVQNQNTIEDESQSQNGSVISIQFSQDNNGKSTNKINFKQKNQRNSKDQDSFTRTNKTSTKFKNLVKTKKSAKFKLTESFDFDFQVFAQNYIPELYQNDKRKFTCLSRRSSKIKTAFFQMGQDHCDYQQMDQNIHKQLKQTLNRQTQTQLIQFSSILKQKKLSDYSLQQSNYKNYHKSTAAFNAHKRNIISYSKKRSSHMGQLSQKFQIQSNNQNNQNANFQFQTNRSVLGSTNLKIKQNNVQNDFFILNISPNFSPKFQITKNLIFTHEDILNLFLTVQNAQSFQWFSLQKQLAIPSSFLKKKGLNYSISAIDANWSYKKSMNSKSTKQKMISYLLNQIKILKVKNKKVHDNLKAFLRFPYSCIKRVQNQGNIMTLDISNIQYTQMSKIISRILKIHEGCIKSQDFTQNQYVCQHLVKFYQKIGIKLE